MEETGQTYITYGKGKNKVWTPVSEKWVFWLPIKAMIGTAIIMGFLVWIEIRYSFFRNILRSVINQF